MRPRMGIASLSLVMLACLVAAASAQGGLAYTVQVAALSDPESAIDQSGRLLRDGFPAYVVRAEGQAGTVFRVRVGAFGDRTSADRYARVMGRRSGGTPRPALAEAIPAGILPLAPTALARVASDERAVLLPWGEDDVALRVGPTRGPARYEPLAADGAFVAYWAVATDAGRDEIVALSLDEGASDDDAAEVREALFRQRLRLMMERSGFTEDAIMEAVRGEPGERHLIVWRSVGSGDAIHGVLAPSAEPTERSESAWLGDVPPDPVEPLHVLAATAAEDDDAAPAVETPEDEADDEPADEPDEAPADGADVDADDEAALEPGEGDEAGSGAAAVTGEVGGETWSAQGDGGWTVLTVGDVTWRALVGTPRHGVGDLLVLEVEDGFEVLRLVPR